MATRVRSHCKINLGLAIGPLRADGFHELATLYQTLELHDVVTVSASSTGGSAATRIAIHCNHPGVPTDSANTAWRMVAKALAHLQTAADVSIEIAKRLPVQGGLGAGSANAAAALIGLELELGLRLPDADRLQLAAQVGSDIPLFLIGGAVLGSGRGELVSPLPDFPQYDCVVATPEISVSTPRAFRDWDDPVKKETARTADLTAGPGFGSLRRLSRSYTSVYGAASSSPHSSGVSPSGGDLAENPLLALVRTGIENDFERVVFPQYPLLGDIKRIFAVSEPDDPERSAVYAALSGSGSAVFGLYATTEAAESAQRRLRELGVPAHLTRTLPRAEYWQNMLLSEAL